MPLAPFKIHVRVHQCVACGFVSLSEDEVRAHNKAVVTDTFVVAHRPNNTLTNHNLMDAGTDEEMAAMLEALTRHDRTLIRILAADVEHAVGLIFDHTHGRDGPTNLRNIQCKKPYVLEARAGSWSKTPLHAWATRKVVQLLGLLADLATTADLPKHVAARAAVVRADLTSPKVCTRDNRCISLLDMADMYADDTATFYRVVRPKDRKTMMDALRTLKDAVSQQLG